MPAADDWPLRGRDGETAQAVDALQSRPPRVVLVTGGVGVGKTRLLAAVGERARTSGIVVATAVASRAAATIPFGALAPLFPGAPGGLADVDAAAVALGRLGAGAPALLVIDDAESLDDASGAAAVAAVDRGEIALLFAVRTGEVVPAPLGRLVADGRVETITLEPLGRDDVAALLSEVLGGAIDGRLVQTMWSSSLGNPMFLRELVVGGIESGLIRREDTLWRLGQGDQTPARLTELIARRLSSLEPAEIEAVELVATAGRIGETAIVAEVGEGTVADLVGRGFLVLDDDGRRRTVRLVHTLYEDVLAEQMGARRRRAAHRRAAEMLRRHGARRHGDARAVLAFQLEAGDEPDPALLARGAEEAFAAHDLDLAERIARLGSAGDPRLQRVLGEVLWRRGRSAEADAVLASLWSSLQASTDLRADERDVELSLVALLRSECLFRGLDRASDAFAVLDAARARVADAGWCAELNATRALLVALAGDVPRAIDAAAPLIAAPSARARLVAGAALALAQTMAGPILDAVALSERTADSARALGRQVARADPALFDAVRVCALAEAGRIDDATTVAQAGYDAALVAGADTGQAVFSLVLGRTALVAGRLVPAERHLREAAAWFGDVRDQGLRRWAFVLLATALAQLGAAREAGDALASADAIAPTALDLAAVDAYRARGWHAAVSGRTSFAFDVMHAGARAARERGQHAVELAVLHDLVRLGDARAVADRMEELLRVVQGPLAASRVAHARAAAAADAAGLDVVSQRFENLGSLLEAAEAAAQAAVLHAEAGHRARAGDSRRRVTNLLVGIGPAATPALMSSSRGLTRREREVALLAARGRSSRVIAEQLGISVRTVDNLLQRVYVKLGVTGRGALAEVLADDADG